MALVPRLELGHPSGITHGLANRCLTIRLTPTYLAHLWGLELSISDLGLRYFILVKLQENIWHSHKDSNLEHQSQNLICYHYTMRAYEYPSVNLSTRVLGLIVFILFQMCTILLKRVTFAQTYWRNRAYRHRWWSSPSDICGVGP